MSHRRAKRQRADLVPQTGGVRRGRLIRSTTTYLEHRSGTRYVWWPLAQVYGKIPVPMSTTTVSPNCHRGHLLRSKS